MRCLLFLENPPIAPEADRVHTFEAAQRRPGAGGPAANSAAAAVEREDEFWTCGAEILQDRAMVRMYGRRLCELVARCLAYVPAHRPSLRQLQREIDAGLAEAGGGVSQADADFFFDPPGPLPAVDAGRPMDTDIWAEYARYRNPPGA